MLHLRCIDILIMKPKERIANLDLALLDPLPDDTSSQARAIEILDANGIQSFLITLDSTKGRYQLNRQSELELNRLGDIEVCIPRDVPQ